jgi:TolA-binding protein
MRRFTLALVFIAGALIAPGRLRGSSADDEFSAAAAHYTAGRWEPACSAFASMLSAHPDHPRAAQARFYYGEALAQAGRHAEARQQFAKLLASAPDSRYAPAAQFRSAEAAYLSGDVIAARRELAAFVDRFGDDELCAYALMHLGNLELTNANPQAARQWFSKSLERFKGGPVADECRLGLAEAAYALGDVQEAAGSFAALTAGGKSKELVARGHSGLGWCRYKDADWAGAAEAFGRLLDECPQSALAVEATLMRASSLEHLDKFEEALVLYEDACKLDPKNGHQAEGLWGAARMQDQLKRPAQAVELYARLVREHADFAELDTALYRWAWLARELGHNDEASEQWRRLRTQCPKSPLVADATLRLAEAALAEGKHEEADTLLADITDAAAPESVRQHAMFLRGRSAMAGGRWEAAEAELAALIKQFPEGDLALSAVYWSAEAAYRQGHYEDAARQLGELATKTPGHDQPWSATAELRRAQALAQLKQWDEALDVARSISSRWPQFGEQYEADYLIGRALVAKAEFDPAREAYLRVIASPQGAASETAAMARFMVGESYFHQENYEAALAQYERAQSDHKFPRWQSAALVQSGKCHEALGQWDAAVAAYEKLIGVDPDGPLAGDARRRAAAAREQANANGSKTKLK